MNLNMARPKNQTEDSLLSKTKNCETLTKQTHWKGAETLDIKFSKSRQTFNFNPSIDLKEGWMIGLTSLEVCNFIFI